MRRGASLAGLDIAIGVSHCVPSNQRITGQGAQFIAGHRRGDYALLWVDVNRLTSQASSSYLPLKLEQPVSPDRLAYRTLHHSDGTDQNYARVRITG